MEALKNLIDAASNIPEFGFTPALNSALDEAVPIFNKAREESKE